MNARFIAGAVAVAIALTAGCKGGFDAKARPVVVAPDGGIVVTNEGAEYARSLFALRCAGCHGTMGQGETHAGVTTPNFHAPAWQARMSDEAIGQIIVQGGQKVGKSPVMPPNPDLANDRETVAALVARIRNFGSP